MDHLHRYEFDRSHWSGLLFRHFTAMHTHQLLLEQISGWILYQHRHHHRSHVPLLGYLSHLRLHICNLTHVPRLESQHVSPNKGCTGPHSRNGLRVCH